jgi:hypothetical protein
VLSAEEGQPYLVGRVEVGPHIIDALGSLEDKQSATGEVLRNGKLWSWVLNRHARVQQTGDLDFWLPSQQVVDGHLETSFRSLQVDGKAVKVGHVDVAASQTSYHVGLVRGFDVEALGII